MPLRFPRLWYGNFDFERELTGRGTMPADAERTTILSAGWLAVAEEGDWIATPLLWPDEFWENLARQCPSLPRIENVCWAEVTRQATHQLAPWGWSTAAARWGAAHGLQGNGPPAEIVRYANSRTFSISCEAAAHCGLAGTALCRSLAAVEAALAVLQRLGHREWVIKAEYSHAARERCRGREFSLTEPQRAWLQKRLQRDGVVAIEPWVASLAEIGVQWEIPPLATGTAPQLIGLTPLRTDSQGGYRGSECSAGPPDLTIWQTAVDCGRRVATQLQADGYFGPLGIDAMHYRTGKTEQIRPLQDINARWTMGRLALGWGERLLQPGESGIWRHHAGSKPTPADSEPSQCRQRIDTSPRLPLGTTASPRTEFEIW